MKIVKLQGGLGNQMFQYAVARALEIHKKKNILFDLSFLRAHNESTEDFTARDFELPIFKNLRSKKLNGIQEKILFSDRIRYKYLRRILNIKIIRINQQENEFVDIPSNIKDIYLNGYFQSEKYFKQIRADLTKDFEFPLLDKKNETLKNIILDRNSVSIHIRRGDYISLKSVNAYHGILNLHYYIESIKRLEKETKEPLSFYLFSDNPEYVKENFSFLPDMQVIDWNTGKDSWKDMALMQACRHHIIANSSFSWWGAWLSERDGISFAPMQWFGDTVKYNINDIVPSDWIIVNE
ncbi:MULTISPECIES: alpha-1,2-fucosyltransferase [unclassified Dysgonomonas]|jgi:uncharacterized protein (UPF0335 family)|uniref:alpha-1,2-fucosyltransferase n=1 Tax=unclassified Dysgonomonas TaxID=2630389 RepID=UPI0025C49B14|nr:MULTISPECIES: alpha-1,2-fucosyltransferase [unclassified Dysgonomonas]MDR2005570.1 alpha-1,2-fucosyltransferase [Prevotella sp.]HMM02883.1 alpha-1,2-fucosyltransferase [Dysgonomonas sp.]